MEMYNPPHPGESLKMLYLKPLGLTVAQMAERLGVARQAVSRIFNGHAGVSAEMALRFARVLGTTPELWINKQRNYDLWHTKQRLKQQMMRLQPFEYSPACE